MQLKRANPNGANNHRIHSLKQNVGFSLFMYKNGYRSVEETVDECRGRDNNYLEGLDF